MGWEYATLSFIDVRDQYTQAVWRAMQVKLVSLGDVQAKVSFRGDIASRPKWAARMLSWGLDLADFEGVPIRLQGFEVQDATMLWSSFIG
jgi:hypothetical protein